MEKTQCYAIPEKIRYAPDQFAMLKRCSETEDISEWNEWRKLHPKRIINLCDAPLAGFTLTNINLDNAVMIRAHLEGAFMPYAHLNNADLTEAFLQGVDLGHAILDDINLRMANLGKASLDMQTNPNNTSLKHGDLEDEIAACLSSASLKNATLAYANLEGAKFGDAILENANLSEANLKDTSFNGANLKNANLDGANLKEANLWQTNLQNANLQFTDFTDATLWMVNIENANLKDAVLKGTFMCGEMVLKDIKDTKTNLKGANFTGTTVNGETMIRCCTIDEKTNFTMVGLDSAKVEPSLLAALKTNIRRIAWNNYYKEQEKSLWGRIKTLPIRLFWWLSDYGSNTVRISKTFLVVSLSFTLVYLAIAYLNPDPAVLSNLKITGNWWLNFMSAFCFAVSTMVTLGFGGINVAIQESAPWATFFALFFVTFNLMIGYFILAVLVTRLGILFQSLAPEQKIKKE
ncbi:MAG: hypothetical protein CVV54_04260 [Synergistetes bacterium HGW-Synergistetes-1]|nr:MAG: hypothetical protein CVV54_04260 [Synergistetes bacterium HGW-Synergistetes-1]